MPGEIITWDLSYRKAAPLPVLLNPTSPAEVEDYLEGNPRNPAQKKARFAVHDDGSLYVLDAYKLTHGDDWRGEGGRSTKPIILGGFEVIRPCAEWNVYQTSLLLKGTGVYLTRGDQLLPDYWTWHRLTESLEFVSWGYGHQLDFVQRANLRRHTRLQEDYSMSELVAEIARRQTLSPSRSTDGS